MKLLSRFTLLALLLSFAFIFVACDGSTPPQDPPADGPADEDTPPIVYLPEYGNNVVDFDSLK